MPKLKNKKEKHLIPLTPDEILHDGFELAILLKGIGALLEICGGILLAFISPARLDSLVRFLTQSELAEDPHDVISNFLVHLSSSFSVGAQHFGVYYLLSHGAVKIVLVWLLWKKKIWAYPLAIFFLFLFIVYQIYRFSYSHSFWLIALSVFDGLMIYLTWMEYRRIQKQPKKA